MRSNVKAMQFSFDRHDIQTDPLLEKSIEDVLRPLALRCEGLRVT